MAINLLDDHTTLSKMGLHVPINILLFTFIMTFDCTSLYLVIATLHENDNHINDLEDVHAI